MTTGKLYTFPNRFIIYTPNPKYVSLRNIHNVSETTLFEKSHYSREFFVQFLDPNGRTFLLPITLLCFPKGIGVGMEFFLGKQNETRRFLRAARISLPQQTYRVQKIIKKISQPSTTEDEKNGG